jgi:8-oxo-dGTP diphosphatase
MEFKIGIFAIILDDANKHVLLCHRRDYDLWNLPGGALEDGEAPWQGVVREVKEETGLEVEVVRLAGIYSKPEVNELVFSFVCSIISGIATEGAEADRIEYFDLESLPDNTIPKQVERIQDSVNDPDRVTMKIQLGPSAIRLIKENKL